MVFWFFGLPGTCKDHCAKLFSKLIDAKYIHVDDFLTERDKEKIITGTFTVEDRLKKLKRVTKMISGILKNNKHIVAADSLPDHKSREYLQEYFKNNIKFILVKVDAQTHQKRISNRKNHFFTEKMLTDYIKQHWQEPIKIPYLTLENNKEGDEALKLTLDILISHVIIK